MQLSCLAHARSGDKGNHANVGVIAYTDDGYRHLCRVLTADAVAAFFAPLQPSRVRRFLLPGIRALNFVLYDVLQGGASQSLRTDSQGKILGLALLQMEIEPLADAPSDAHAQSTSPPVAPQPAPRGEGDTNELF